jgi:nitrogen regulatory protein PII
VPGWYSCEEKIDNGYLSGKITYYKNGELKLVATFKSDLTPNISGMELTIMGKWKVENGYLKEEVIQVTSTPQFIGDALYVIMKKEENGSPGDKIIHVNDNELRVKTRKGETITYNRIQK